MRHHHVQALITHIGPVCVRARARMCVCERERENERVIELSMTGLM